MGIFDVLAKILHTDKQILETLLRIEQLLQGPAQVAGDPKVKVD